MNSQLTAQVAALISAKSFSLVEGTEPFSPDTLCDFWFHGQEHVKDRRTVLKSLTQDESQIEASAEELEILFKDFFAEEMLIRIVTAIYTAADKRRQQCQAEPIARSLFLSFLDVKKLILNAMVAEQGLSTARLKRINTMRRSIERWTDLLLGQYVLRFDLDEYAHDAARSRDFGEDQISDLNTLDPGHAWNLITAGLNISFPAGLTSQTNAHWDAMLGAVLSCYPPESFNQSAMMKSLRQMRFERSGWHAETHPGQIPEKLYSLLHNSPQPAKSQMNPKPGKPFESGSSLSPNQAINFSQLRNRHSNESS